MLSYNLTHKTWQLCLWKAGRQILRSISRCQHNLGGSNLTMAVLITYAGYKTTAQIFHADRDIIFLIDFVGFGLQIVAGHGRWVRFVSAMLEGRGWIINLRTFMPSRRDQPIGRKKPCRYTSDLPHRSNDSHQQVWFSCMASIREFFFMIVGSG